MPQYRAKIVTAEFLDKKDLLVFTMRDLATGREQTYCWPPCDYFAAIGIPRNASYKPEHLHEHCARMIGKEISFVVEGETPPVSPAVDPQKAEEIAKECAEMAEQAGTKLDQELKVAQELTRRRFGLSNGEKTNG